MSRRDEYDIFVCGGSQHVDMLRALLPRLRPYGFVHVASTFMAPHEEAKIGSLCDALHRPRYADVPMSRVPEMLRTIADIQAKYDLKIPTVGHIGDGNLHPTISFDGTDPDQVARVEEATAELFAKVIELGGTLTGEHGIGLDKAKYMSLEHDQIALEFMRSLKRFFDPNNILNPGKMALEA